jgi:anti-sigma regulatory factor (Ser/Thr protein kinase)
MRLVMMRESWLPATPESAPRARAIVREAAAEQGLDGDGAWDLMLATTEAVANAIRHGAPCQDGGRGILLRVLPWDDGNGLFVEVGDCGTFEASARPAEHDAEHGRGIPIITAVVDHFELLPEGPLTRVRFGKRALAA